MLMPQPHRQPIHEGTHVKLVEKYVGPMLALFFNNIVAPNFLWAFMLVISVAYYQSTVEGGSPTWRTVAAGSMAIVGTLAGLGYKDFVGRMKRMEEDMKRDRELREKQHANNIRAIIALARAGQDRDKLDEVIDQLLREIGRAHV